ncbi:MULTISPECIES: cation:proton antiporter domain-containing protein [unclassified Streptomyces]|uniref:cation:proton antiporter domain-containing protein n=1 Tax=unclassified Streptomyces TaxID=2593676 RepID=UPI002E277416|nr:cation:proton antiporter [Streptomyces sp. NBC_01001]
MSSWALVAAGAVIVCYAALSRRLSTTVVSGPLVFMAAGLAMGPLGLGLVEGGGDPESVRALLESALAVVLFTDAAAIRRGELRREGFVPLRLLALGLPLTFALGWLVAWPLLPGLGAWELALVAVILGPTDAALGQQAISDRRVPALVRHGLDVESGLNDGLALPFFLLALAAAGGGHGEQGIGETFLRALLLSSAIGFVGGWAVARLLRWSASRTWTAHGWHQLSSLAVPIVTYPLAVAVEGSGFIAVWVAGLAFGNVLRPSVALAGDVDADAAGSATEFAERLGLLLASLSFLAFGAAVLGPVLEHLTWQMPVYAVLSLTVIRMLPVAAALLGTGLRPATVAYIGWFGPRGLASIVFGLLAVEEHLPGTRILDGAVAVTVALSVCLHGATAPLLGGRYGAWYARALAADPGLKEHADVPAEGVRTPRAGPDAAQRRRR